MTKGFAALWDGNTACVGSLVKTVEAVWYLGRRFPAGYIFMVEAVVCRRLKFTFNMVEIWVPASACITAN